jgi:hypothetical protein
MNEDIGSDLQAGVLRPRELLCNGRVWVCDGAASNVGLGLEWCDKWNKVEAYDPKEGYTLSLGDVVPTGTLDAMIFIHMKYGASVGSDPCVSATLQSVPACRPAAAVPLKTKPKTMQEQQQECRQALNAFCDWANKLVEESGQWAPAKHIMVFKMVLEGRINFSGSAKIFNIIMDALFVGSIEGHEVRRMLGLDHMEPKWVTESFRVVGTATMIVLVQRFLGLCDVLKVPGSPIICRPYTWGQMVEASSSARWPTKGSRLSCTAKWRCTNKTS